MVGCGLLTSYCQLRAAEGWYQGGRDVTSIFLLLSPTLFKHIFTYIANFSSRKFHYLFFYTIFCHNIKGAIVLFGKTGNRGTKRQRLYTGTVLSYPTPRIRDSYFCCYCSCFVTKKSPANALSNG